MDGSTAYSKLREWARAFNLPMKEAADACERAEEFALCAAMVRMSDRPAPLEPDREAVRVVISEFLSVLRESPDTVVGESPDTSDQRISLALERLITEAAARVVAAKENQPYFGCGR